MHADEIEALRIAGAAAQTRGWPWRPPYWIDLEDGEWRVQAENECVIRISEATGRITPEIVPLDPSIAISAAKDYARSRGLGWKPSFTMRLESDCWEVGSCQHQLGGQTHIYVSHQGVVLRHWVNPK